ncbi:MAG TPA: MBL fold metallo-hydrolase, partial [Ktedonobacteraceae bacterium]
MRITSLGSGSSGNAYLIEAGPQRRTRLLVDAGFPARILGERLRRAGCEPGQLRGVLITHEHSDHIMGLPFLLKRHRVPVYADPRTLGEIRGIFSSGALRSESGALVYLDAEAEAAGLNGSGPLSTPGDLLEENKLATETGAERAGESGSTASLAGADGLWQPLPAGTSCVIGDIEVHSFPVSHDAIAPCGYVLSAGGCRVCIITDSGEVTPVMLEAITRADLLILESNHDRARLISGPYPYHLKQRILSPTGHLSNDQAAIAVLQTWRGDAVRWLWLAHLSRTNNTRKIALASMLDNLRAAHANLEQIHITVLDREMGGTWDSAMLWKDEH